MRLQVLDPAVRFSCGSCTFCCDQPWRTLIEAEKAFALDEHDFSAYPRIAGKRFYKPADADEPGLLELAKGEGTRCLFLDTDGLCIIHKELGAAAKPSMCRQFPFLPARTWVDDRVSANFGCPSVQGMKGKLLNEQSADVAEVVPVSQRPVNRDGVVMIDAQCKVPLDLGDALFDRLLAIFAEGGDADLWSRFAEALADCVFVRDRILHPRENGPPDDLAEALRSSGPLHEPADVPAIEPFPQPARAPMPVRFLFAATLFPDTVPADATRIMGLFRRLTLVPKIMSLAKLSGGYASRLLGRNVSIDDVLHHPLDGSLEQGATDLLLRYYRSRLWQRFPAGTRLSVIAGLHQHVHDLNAIVFLARAEAHHRGNNRLDEGLIKQALTRVEFHLANQTRLYDQTLKGWLRSSLQDPGLAVQSLRLMALRQPAAALTPPYPALRTK